MGLEEIYAIYPRKMGKTRGMKTLKKISDNKDELLKLKQAVENYKKYCSITNKTLIYIKLWSTFANEWEEWVDIDLTAFQPQNQKTDIGAILRGEK